LQLQVKMEKAVAQAFATSQLSLQGGDADRALNLFTPTGTSVLVEGKLTRTPEGTKQVKDGPRLHVHDAHALYWH
jgi:hypothetical protein